MAVIIYTRHTLTERQAELIGETYIGQFLRDPAAHRTLLTDDDAAEVVRGWLGRGEQNIAVYGVFPPILRAWLHDQDTGGVGACVTLYEWHNTTRAAEGASPTAETLGGNRWVETGQYFISPGDCE